MTPKNLRDEFALTVTKAYVKHHGFFPLPEVVYRLADEMMAERDKKQEPQEEPVNDSKGH